MYRNADEIEKLKKIKENCDQEMVGAMKQKDWSDPQPDSTIQPKARGLLHMEREYFAHHI